MLGDIDILLIPVGGFFTIEPEEAKILAEKIKPRIVIPMHYKTDYIKDWNIKPVEEFLRGISFPVKRMNSSKVTINEEDKPLSTEVYLLKI
jgi:L-ascorbate metabolism protein UlaG (beta-lactamase superfamily)